MAPLTSTLNFLLSKSDRPAIRAFFLSITALSVALILALYSGAAAQLGNVALASASAIIALLVAAWVAVTLVPVLAKRTALRWIGYRMEYRVTLEGWIYIVGVVLVALAALNTGNNLLFLILASLIASILMSGILSSITLAGVEMRLQLPEHIFAAEPVRASLELKNEKLTLPSFSLRVEGVTKKDAAAPAVLETPVYFPYIPRQEAVSQTVPLLFPKRGVYRQEAFRIVTRFPFGFLQKARRLDLAAEALVYPSVEASPEFLEVLPGIQGAMESLTKGRGQDLYSLRDYVPTDSARHVHWKATARFGSLMVREFAREEVIAACCSSLTLTASLLCPLLLTLKKTALNARFPFAPQSPGVSTNAVCCSNFAVLQPRLLSLPPPTTSSSFFAISPAFSLFRPTLKPLSIATSPPTPNRSRSSSPRSPAAPSPLPSGTPHT